MNAQQPPAVAPARILIVDDTPANLALLVDALQAAGHRPIVATSGEMALDRLAQSPPDLVLLDMRMPGMDGLEVCRRMQADSCWREIPVIFMTAVEEPEQKVAAFHAGAVDYVTKPFDTGEVLARAATHLRLKSLQHDLAEELAWRAETERTLGASLALAVIVAAHDGEILFATERAARLLREHFGGAVGTLPRALSGLADGTVARIHVDLLFGSIEVRTIGAAGQDLLTLVLEEHRTAANLAALRALGLSERESEVLFWMSEGKSNPEIALIIGAAPATVKKHAENIFAKLAIENRAAAIRLALDTLRGS